MVRETFSCCSPPLFTEFDETRRRNVTVFLLIALVVFASSPILSPLNNGHDLGFHLYRIEGIAEAIKDGSFPVRMQYSQMLGMGYPVSIMYPDIFLYFPAFLRLIGFSVTASYRAFVLILNVFVVLTTYIFTKRFSKSRPISFTVTCVWTLGTYRLMDVYLRAAVGEYTALAFFPMIAYGIWCCFTTQGRETTRLHPSVWLTFGMTGVVLSHVLSVLLAVFALLPILIITVFKGDKKAQGWLSLLSASVFTTILSAWFVVPFIYWYFTQDMAVEHSAMVTAEYASKMTGTLGQLLAILPTMFGTSGNATVVSYQRMPLALGIGGLCFLCLGVITVLLFKHKVIGRLKVQEVSKGIYANAIVVLLICFFVCVVLCCCSFVWKDKIWLMSKLAVIQFPWRLIGPILFILVSLGAIAFVVIQKNCDSPKLIYILCVVISLLTLIEGGHSMTSVAYETTPQESVEAINEQLIPARQDIGVGEYLPTSFSYSSIPSLTRKIADGNYECTISTSSDRGRVFNVDIPSSLNRKTIELPLIYYQGYQIINTSSNDVNIEMSKDGLLQLNVPEGYEGCVSLKWVEPRSWRYSTFVSAIFLLILLSYVIKKQIPSKNSVQRTK